MIQDFSTAVVELKHFPYPEDFDEDCRFACDFFNSVGLTTKYSCSGHGIDEFCIIFDDSVESYLIELFQLYAFDKHPLGRFVMWKRLVHIDGKDYYWNNWMYCMNAGFRNLDVRAQREIRNITTTVTKDVLSNKLEEYIGMVLKENLLRVKKDIEDFTKSMKNHGFTFTEKF